MSARIRRRFCVPFRHLDFFILSSFVIGYFVISFPGLAAHAEAIGRSPVDFEQDVARTLIVNCLGCHNASEPEGGLDLTGHARLLAGGDSGPAIVPGNVDESYLLDRIRDGEMPPEDEGTPLTADQLTRLEQWVRDGAPWPDDRELNQYEFSAEGRAGLDWWSFQRPVRPTPPTADETLPQETGSSAGRNPIDAFVLYRLREHDLQPSVAADRVTLRRRLTFDLWGLPATPEEIDAFVNDTSSDAYERLVDRLLASPHYGERWGRHWLDLVRYADTNGYETDNPRPTAWHYRDYVIGAFNRDLPYDRFIAEQIAGDATGVRDATGFLVCAAFDNVTFRTKNQMQRLQVRQDELHEFVNTTTQTFLGLTAACSRCHDHKFDPILQQDYYALQAIFDGIRHPERTITHYPFRDELKVERSEEEAKKLIAELTEEEKSLPPAPDSERRMDVRSMLLALDAKLNGKNLDNMPYAVFTDEPHGPTYLLNRGEVTQRRETVLPVTFKLLGDFPQLDNDTPEQERRLALAQWIASSENPLTARVMVNRIWQHHFGVGLVDTPSNFGGQGSQPTHPDLLDWLACEFVERDWSMKAMHRLIVSSSTYRQSASSNERAVAVDAGNRLLWRFPSRRLEAEAIRDSVLHVSGKLNTSMGGPGYNLLKKHKYRTYTPLESFGENEWRRMVYEFRVRIETDPTFGVMDCPDGGQLCPQRTRSTTPLQALNLLNSKFMVEQSEHFAARVTETAGDIVHEQVELAFRLAYGRRPDETQQTDCSQFVDQHGLPALCRAIFNSNEFLFLP